MKRIMLVCAAGMSTSLLVSKMKKANEELKEDIDVFALSESEALSEISDVDLILLGPQVTYLYENFSMIASYDNVRVSVIDPIMYGRMDGVKVLNEALKLLQEQK